MIDRKQYEECFCPEGKDPIYPQNWTRKKYVLDYPKHIEPPYPSDADYTMLVNKTMLIDSLDNYSIGVYLRLVLLSQYYHDWTEIYNYGSKAYVDKALQKLQELNYIKFLEDGTLRIYM